MRARAMLLVLAGLSILIARPSWAQAPAPTGRPPFRYTLRAVDVRPPLRVADRANLAPSPSSALPASLVLRPIPRVGLWSSALDRAVAEFDALSDVSATAISALLQRAPIDALISGQAGPWVPAGTPPPVPTGVTVAPPVRLQPVAIVSPAPVSGDARGQQVIVPSAVLELPWMIP